MQLVMRMLDDVSKAVAEAKARDLANIGRLLAATDNSWRRARDLATRQGSSSRVLTLLAKGLSGLTTSELGPDYTSIARAFAATLQNVGVFDGLLPDMVAMPLRTHAVILTGAATSTAASDGQTRAVSKIELGVEKLEHRKVSTTVVLSEELVGSSSEATLNLILQQMRVAVVAGTDGVFIEDLVAGVTPLPMSGTDSESVWRDLGKLLAALPTGQASRLHWVMSSANAKALATKTTALGGLAFPTMTAFGGTLAGVPAHVSDHIGDVVLLVDASAFAAGADEIVLRGTRQGTIRFISNPADGADAPGTGAASVVSLFQTNSAAMLAERVFDFKAIRPGAVAALSGVAWAYEGGSPA
jgi:hypothetical protein